MGSKTSKSTQTNSPPAWATPLFKQSADVAGNLFNQGTGGNTWLGSTVAPLSGTTMSGVNQLAQAGSGWNTAGTRPLFQQLGAASVSDPFVNKLSGVADQFKGIIGQAGDPSSAETNLQGYASGKNLTGEGNPFYRQRLDSELADTAAQTQSQFSGAGRYGSSADTRTLADRLGAQRTAALEGDWNREQANQFNAVGMIDAAKQGRLGLQGNMLGAQGNIYGAAGGLRGAGLDRAAGAATSMSGIDQRNFENRLAGAGATLQAGGLMDAQAQKLQADQIAKFYALDNQDWDRLGMLQAAASGAAGPYGSQVATSRQPVGISGILSGIGSLMPAGKSDARLKDNIVPVGYRNGHVLWEFTYKGSAEKFRGVMAQMVMETRPDAVVMEEDGFYAVDYAKLGFPMERVFA